MTSSNCAVVSLLLFVVLTAWFVVICTTSVSDYDLQDYEDHPCVRNCVKGEPPKVCKYRWLLENYYVLSMACANCPFNQSDCFLPHCVPANGVQRGIKTVNRKLPGPAIQVCTGDTIQVRVDNRMEVFESTTIHWHGVLQSQTPYMDGVAMVTQCPIPAMTHFTYRFLADNAGTHLWHAHAGFQRADGLFGALVVRNSADLDLEPSLNLYDHDLPEHVIVLNDWVDETGGEWFGRVSHYGGSFEPKYLLINGLGPDKADVNPKTPRATFKVKPGQRYRFRVINSGSLECTFQLSIDNHNMTLIATDGSNVEPFTVDSINMYTGERYDFVLDALHVDTPKKYWIRLAGIGTCVDAQLFQTAILEYEGSDDVVPKGKLSFMESIRGGKELNPFDSKGSETKPLITQLRSADLDDDTMTSLPNRRIYLGLDFLPVNNPRMNNPKYYPFNKVHPKFKRYTSQINHISMHLPSSPPLTQFEDLPESTYCAKETMADHESCVTKFCECVHRYQVALGDLVELVVVDEGKLFQASHPMHLHGYKYRVVAYDKVGFSTSVEQVKAMDARGQIHRLTSRAPIKDTVTFPDGGYVVLRFRADNPGVWLFHCHVHKHAELGMSVMLQVGNYSQWTHPPRGFPTCGSWPSNQDGDDDSDSLSMQLSMP